MKTKQLKQLVVLVSLSSVLVLLGGCASKQLGSDQTQQNRGNQFQSGTGGMHRPNGSGNRQGGNLSGAMYRGNGSGNVQGPGPNDGGRPNQQENPSPTTITTGN